MCICARPYKYKYKGVYQDSKNETLVQFVFRNRMNGITLDDLASDMCVRLN